MAHTEYEKTHKVTLGVLNQDHNAAQTYGPPCDMAKAHHAAVILDIGVLASDVICTLWQGIESDAIVGVVDGGAGASSFDIAGDKSALYLATLRIVVTGSTANDGIYTVRAAGSSYAAGVTTILIDEDLADATVDGVITLVKAFTVAKTATYTTTTDECVDVIEVEASELDVANGYKQIVVQLGGAGANAGYVGAIIHRYPLRVEPASLVT